MLRILLVRFSSIGDILLTTPLLRALRTRHPAGEIHLLTSASYAPLVSDNPRLDRVLTLRPGQTLPALAAEIRAKRYTHLLDLQGSLRSVLLRLLVRGRWTGYDKRRVPRELLIRTKENRYGGLTPVPERYFEAAGDLGVAPDGGPPEFFLGEAARAEAEARLGPHGRASPMGRVALAPGAGHPSKRWPVEHWKALAGRLSAAGYQVLVLGGAPEVELGREVAAAGGARSVSLAGELGLQGTGVVIQRSLALVAGDTGVMHMATGLGTPVVALFGPTVREFGFFPYRARAAVLERGLDCRPCSARGGARCPLGHHRCLRDISPAEVEQALEPFLR